jgi:hypothetical protein
LCSISCLPSLDFPAVSVVTGSRIFRLYLVVPCRDFPAVSAVTGSQIFRPYQVLLAGIFRPYLQLLAAEFSGRICICQDFLALPFLAPEGREFPAVSVISGRDFPAVAFPAWVI